MIRVVAEGGNFRVVDVSSVSDRRQFYSRVLTSFNLLTAGDSSSPAFEREMERWQFFLEERASIKNATDAGEPWWRKIIDWWCSKHIASLAFY